MAIPSVGLRVCLSVDRMTGKKEESRNDLIATYKILNDNHNISRDLIFNIDSNGLREHEKMFKRRFLLDVFSN